MLALKASLEAWILDGSWEVGSSVQVAWCAASEVAVTAKKGELGFSSVTVKAGWIRQLATNHANRTDRPNLPLAKGPGRPMQHQS